MESWSCSQRRICHLYGVPRSTVRRKAMASDAKQEITELLIRLADTHKRWGFGLMFRWLRRQGYTWNHKRVYKVYCELALNGVAPRIPLALHPGYIYNTDTFSI